MELVPACGTGLKPGGAEPPVLPWTWEIIKTWSPVPERCRAEGPAGTEEKQTRR